MAFLTWLRRVAALAGASIGLVSLTLAMPAIAWAADDARRRPRGGFGFFGLFSTLCCLAVVVIVVVLVLSLTRRRRSR